MNATTKNPGVAFLENFDPNSIPDLEAARRTILVLLNLVEGLAAENRALREEIQRLQDQANRLNGVPGKPEVKANRTTTEKPAHPNHSSEKERREPKVWNKHAKLPEIKIGREQVCTINRPQLPADAVFKGYEQVVVQDLKIITDNIPILERKVLFSLREQDLFGVIANGVRR